MDLMLDLLIDVTGYEHMADEKKIEAYVHDILALEFPSTKPLYISILLTSDENIRLINREYRHQDKATDVLSFAYHETEDFDIGPYETLGDIVISLERVVVQAKEYCHGEERELFYVITHGILHLLGYDHMNEQEKKIMRKKEEQLLTAHQYVRDEDK
jgi:probable rRNA maturation factor